MLFTYITECLISVAREARCLLILCKVQFNNNNTAGYHQHIFRPAVLFKMSLKKVKAFFFNKYSLFIKFGIFSKFDFFSDFSQKTSQLQ